MLAAGPTLLPQHESNAGWATNNGPSTAAQPAVQQSQTQSGGEVQHQTNPPSNEAPGSSGGSSGSTGPNTNSTSPEFNELASLLQSMMNTGAPATPPLQDNSTPTAVPTTATGNTSVPLVVGLFAVAGALGYYYYRKHGGASIHEAL